MEKGTFRNCHLGEQSTQHQSGRLDVLSVLQNAIKVGWCRCAVDLECQFSAEQAASGEVTRDYIDKAISRYRSLTTHHYDIVGQSTPTISRKGHPSDFILVDQITRRVIRDIEFTDIHMYVRQGSTGNYVTNMLLV